MYRKIAAVMALAVVGFFLAIGIASASSGVAPTAAPTTSDYVPSPVTSTSSTPDTTTPPSTTPPTTTQVLSTSRTLSPTTHTTAPTTSSTSSTAPTTSGTVTTTQVLATTQTTSKPLASTGSGINVGFSIAVGAIILLVGIGLTIVGTKMSRRGGAKHS